MIVLPIKIMNMVGISPYPYKPPAPIAAVRGYKFMIGGLPTYFNFDNTKQKIIFMQVGKDGVSSTGYIDKGFTNYSGFFQQYRANFIFYTEGNRTYSQVRYSLSPYDGRIDGVQISTPKNLAYCGTGSGTNISRFLAPFMDALNQAVVLSTYTGGVTGGGDTATLNGNADKSAGYNSGWNGTGILSPQEAIIDPVLNKGDYNLQSVQFDESHIAVINGNYLEIYSFDNGVHDVSSCIWNIILPKCDLIQKYYLPDFIPGTYTYGYAYGNICAPMDSTITFGVQGVNFSSGHNYVLHFRFPGPILHTLDMGTSGEFRPVWSYYNITSDGYLIQLYDTGNIYADGSWNKISTDKIDLSITFSTPAQIPQPQQVNAQNTAHHKIIERGF